MKCLETKFMKKIVSYSLFGSSPRYTINALINADLCLKYYLDWTCRMYYDDSVPSYIIDELKKKKNTELIEESNYNGDYRRMWRFFAYDDCDIFISRDIDSHITERERISVEEWIDSDKNLHIMRDNGGHKSKIQAGMFGIKKCDKLINFKQKCIDYSKTTDSFPQMDERFLERIYTIFLGDMAVYDDRDYYGDRNRNWKTIIDVDSGQIYGDKEVHKFLQEYFSEAIYQFIGQSQYPPSINQNLFKKYVKEVYSNYDKTIYEQIGFSL